MVVYFYQPGTSKMLTIFMAGYDRRERLLRRLLSACLVFSLLGVTPAFVGAQAVVDSPTETVEGQVVAPGVANRTLTEAQPTAQPLSESGGKTTALTRITRDIRYLASDELAGRQPGTPEMQLAEDFIVQQYQEAGVAGAASDGSYLQRVPVDGTRTVDKNTTQLTFTGPDGQKMTPVLNESFACLVGRKPSSINGGLVFVGYGIAANEHNYNEFRDVDVEGKIVVVIRREPQQSSPESVFDGEQTSDHSFIMSKIRAARKAGAIGIVMVNDAETVSNDDNDRLVQSNQFGTVSFPFYQIKRSALNEMLVSSPLHGPTGKTLRSLEQVEAWIDSRLEPISQPIKGWAASAEASFPKTDVVTSNLVAVVPGQGNLAEETVIVGAHYDHIGRGAYGSRTPWRKEIHNGADDNATGTAAVLELARRFASKNPNDAPRRRLVLICFTAEEMGLLGALHYVAEPLFEIKDTVAMVNFDMIGLLREKELTIYNWNTSRAFASMFAQANESSELTLKFPAAAFAGSDHLPFNQSKIPNMFIHTGISDTYHTPDDTFETINCEGVVTVVDFSERVLEQLLTSEKPVYGKPKRFQLGLQLDREGDESGLKITKVIKDSIAERAGIRKGDIVLSVDGDTISKRRELVRRIRRDVGKMINLKIRRGAEEIDFQIELKSKP
jgi:hypothetical protein